MQIQLKQVEIVEALKQFISQKGINLVGKTFGISFTAGRKEGGLSADISIEDDSDIPGVDGADNSDKANAPVVLTVVKAVPVAAVAGPTADEAVSFPATDTPAVAFDSEKPTTTSLFG